MNRLGFACAGLFTFFSLLVGADASAETCDPRYAASPQFVAADCTFKNPPNPEAKRSRGSWDIWMRFLTERKVGTVPTMTLNRNPANVFQETEQSAFAPGNLVPGIEPSEDRLLQGRVFSYNDTQLYRVGTNVFQLPINAPKAVVNNNNQDGDANSGVRNGKVNYEPSRLAPKPQDATLRYSALPLSGSTQQARIAKTLNFRQAGDFYRSLPKQEQANLVSNLAGDLGQVKDDAAKYTMLSFFYKADSQYGAALARATNADASRVQQLASALSE